MMHRQALRELRDWLRDRVVDAHELVDHPIGGSSSEVNYGAIRADIERWTKWLAAVEWALTEHDG